MLTDDNPVLFVFFALSVCKNNCNSSSLLSISFLPVPLTDISFMCLYIILILLPRISIFYETFALFYELSNALVLLTRIKIKCT